MMVVTVVTVAAVPISKAGSNNGTDNSTHKGNIRRVSSNPEIRAQR